MKGILFLNGDPPQVDIIKTIASEYGESAIYCTDGAYNYLTDYLNPGVIIGDFDSLDRTSIKRGEIITFDSDKNFTDGYLALKIMTERGFTDIDIYGAYGGRPDMAESNFTLLTFALKKGIKARFCGGTVAYMINGMLAEYVKKGVTVSLVPFSDNLHILYTRGLKYVLTDYTMKKFDNVDSADYIMGVSNISEEEHIEIAIDSGIALVFIEEKAGG